MLAATATADTASEKPPTAANKLRNNSVSLNCAVFCGDLVAKLTQFRLTGF